MSNLEKSKNLIPDLAGKDVEGIVSLVNDSYQRNGLIASLELQFIKFKLNDDPKLAAAAKSNPESLYNCILQAAESGLSFNPQWQECYFVPYNMTIDGKTVPTVTFSPMYRGKKKLLIVKEVVKNIETELVYKDEYFEENIINGVHEIIHKPNTFIRSNTDNIVGGYAIITLNNGEKKYIVKGRDYFERCKKASEKKMFGKTSPAWSMWYDQMAEKCLVNAADSSIPKIGLNENTIKLLNDINTNDIDYIDVSNESELPAIEPEKKVLSSEEYSELINSLYDYEISLKSAQKKYKGYEFTDEQKKEIKEAGTIADKQLTEICEIIQSGEKTFEHFEFFLTAEQKQIVKNSLNV